MKIDSIFLCIQATFTYLEDAYIIIIISMLLELIQIIGISVTM
jgi:hypothetical protein